MTLTPVHNQFKKDLFISTLEKNVKKVKIMIKGQGLDFLYDDLSPLMLACSQEKLIALNMIHHGLNPNLENSKGRTALFYACLKGDNEVVKELYKVNGFKRLIDNYDDSILHCAARSTSKQVVTFLLDIGIDPNIRDSQNQTPLHLAAWHENPEICEILIKRGAQVNVLDNKNKPPILYSSKLDTIKMLLGYNAQILKSNDETLIHNLVKMQKFDEIKYLHEFLGSEKVEEILGPNLCNPLLYSVFKEDYKMTKYLISKGYSVNVSNEMGLTPLMRAVEKGNFVLVKLLVDNGANVNSINKRNENAFLIACKHNNLKIIKYLHEFNENINFQDDTLYTPLMWASMYKYDAVCDFLIENGADHLLKNNYNKTAMVLADEMRNDYFKKEVWIY